MDRKILDTETGGRLISIMRELGIDNSETYTEDAEGQEYISRFNDVTEAMIHDEVLAYIRDNPDGALGVIMQCGLTI
jgi:hypothetical protein